MFSSRRRTAWVAAVWLFCHGLALSAPIATAAIAAAEDLCTCPGGTPGAVCPMHHHGKMPAPTGPQVRNGCEQPDALMLSLAGGLGVLPDASLSAPLVLLDAHVASISREPIQHIEVPDAPPPRA